MTIPPCIPPWSHTHTLVWMPAGGQPCTVAFWVAPTSWHDWSGCVWSAYTREMYMRERFGIRAHRTVQNSGWGWRPLTEIRLPTEQPDMRGWRPAGGCETPGSVPGAVILLRVDPSHPAPSAAWARWGSYWDLWEERHQAKLRSDAADKDRLRIEARKEQIRQVFGYDVPELVEGKW